MVATGMRVPRTHGTRNDTGPLVTLRSPRGGPVLLGDRSDAPHASGWECPSRRGCTMGADRPWWQAGVDPRPGTAQILSLIHISEPTRRTPISYAVFCLKKK